MKEKGQMIWFWGCEAKEILFTGCLENMNRGQGFYDAKGSHGWFYPTFHIMEFLSDFEDIDF